MSTSGELLESGNNVMSNIKFTTVDYLLFIILLIVSLAIGIYSAYKGRGKASTQEYLLGGREMAPGPVAMSLLGGHISAISILGLSTEIYYYGTQLTISLVGSFIAALIVRSLILPVFYPLKLVSINEYIGLRYKSQGLRKLVTLGHILMSLIYIGFCLYTPSLVLSTVTNLPTYSSVLIMGTICTIYVTIGGVRAVVYTDVMQTLLMFGGVLLVVILCCIDLGGFKNVWDIAEEGGRIQFFNMDPSPFVRHTFWSTLVVGHYSMLTNLGLTQSTYQRFASVKTLTIAKRLCIAFIVGVLCVLVTFYFSGLVAYATYSNCDPLDSGKIEKADQIIPFLVTDRLSYVNGMSGIFVAAVYGGILSSISSSGNSVACQIWEDFVKDLPIFKNISDAKSTTVVKFLSLLTGVIGTALGLVVGRLGNIFHILSSIMGALSGPISGLFLTGIFIPGVNTKGAFAGLLVGFVFNVWLGIGKLMRSGGSPQMLPLSIEGCFEDVNVFPNTTVAAQLVSNMTLATFGPSTSASWFNETTSLSSDSSSSLSNVSSYTSHTMYDISYCYNGTMGVCITMIVSFLFSICTGLVQPEDVEPRLVNASCLRLHLKLWNLLCRGRTVSNGSYRNAEAVLHMLPKTASQEQSQQK